MIKSYYDHDPLERWGWHEHVPVWGYDWLTDDGSTVESPTFESQAVLSLKVGDESYSGTFHIPLCFSCACLPHNSLPDGFRIL